MKIIETKIPGLLVIEPRVFEDERGYFFESYNRKAFVEAGLDFNFVQDNQSKSGYGVIRGLHYQLEPHSQTKLVRVLQGKILDVCVDIRRGSPSFGEWVAVDLSEDNKKQMLVPRGFAHGFSVLSETAVVFYKCDEFYHPEADRGIRYNDKTLNIDWKINPGDARVSEKDKKHPVLSEAENNFIYR
ncbi:MAG: dTDP-4-dehydrorhamnose 3,5-epimerase [Calditrichia bacterium]